MEKKTKIVYTLTAMATVAEPVFEVLHRAALSDEKTVGMVQRGPIPHALEGELGDGPRAMGRQANGVIASTVSNVEMPDLSALLADAGLEEGPGSSTIFHLSS
jgi:hypothetical protein